MVPIEFHDLTWNMSERLTKGHILWTIFTPKNNRNWTYSSYNRHDNDKNPDFFTFILFSIYEIAIDVVYLDLPQNSVRNEVPMNFTALATTFSLENNFVIKIGTRYFYRMRKKKHIKWRKKMYRNCK